MKYIAFKRAKHCPMVEACLHPEFIVEYADTSLFVTGFHKAEEGYEIFEEEMFNEEFAKNEERQKEFNDKLHQDHLARIAMGDMIAQQKAIEDRKAQAEFEEFKAWKNSQKKR